LTNHPSQFWLVLGLQALLTPILPPIALVVRAPAPAAMALGLGIAVSG
jgi:hypothetical protein